jgi:aryl-alcohol dehydrogenase-like predicted oxidoreductase
VIVKEALANGRLADRGSANRLLGDDPHTSALGAALARPWADVVLSGAVTVGQLRSNVAALGEPMPSDDERLAGLALDPQVYWSERARMRWT